MTSAARDLIDTGTPGPWWRMQADGWSFHSPTAIEVGSAADRADARKIVAAVNALPLVDALIEAIDALVSEPGRTDKSLPAVVAARDALEAALGGDPQ